MHIPILIEPIAGGRFRARAGEPFGACVEGDTAADARNELEMLLRQRLQNGASVATIDLGNGAPEAGWFFNSLCEAIAEKRQQEDEPVP